MSAALGSRVIEIMQVTETVSDGLKREFQVTVPAADLETRMAGRLAELKDRVQLRGFRPGKVPVTHLRKVYGRSVMAETVETIIRELNAQIVEERGLRLAREPKVTIPNEETEVEPRHRWQGRSRLHAVVRGAAGDHARRFRQHQAGAAGRRRRRQPRSTRR